MCRARHLCTSWLELALFPYLTASQQFGTLRRVEQGVELIELTCILHVISRYFGLSTSIASIPVRIVDIVAQRAFPIASLTCHRALASAPKLWRTWFRILASIAGKPMGKIDVLTSGAEPVPINPRRGTPGLPLLNRLGLSKRAKAHTPPGHRRRLATTIAHRLAGEVDVVAEAAQPIPIDPSHWPFSWTARVVPSLILRLCRRLMCLILTLGGLTGVARLAVGEVDVATCMAGPIAKLPIRILWALANIAKVPVREVHVLAVFTCPVAAHARHRNAACSALVTDVGLELGSLADVAYLPLAEIHIATVAAGPIAIHSSHRWS
mmetsp:Transcript_26276/g.60909  ORF Transcript_26276/g.60909 Transcript_26276/m.60909 type:complete len:323 (+) Transcript_26276:57-1025(+)